MTTRGMAICLLAVATMLLAGCASQTTGPRGQVLVLGASGQLGAEIVRRLRADGRPVAVLVRATADRKRLADQEVEYLTGDVTSDADIAAAFKGRRYSSVVVALRVTNGDIHFYEKALTPLTKYARQAGVRRIIHHGAVGAGDSIKRIDTKGWERIPGIYDRIKDQTVGENLIKASGLTYTIIRNSRIYPDGSPPTGKAQLTEDDSVVSPMTRADLAIFTVRCLDDKTCANKTYHVRDDSLAWPPPGAARP